LHVTADHDRSRPLINDNAGRAICIGLKLSDFGEKPRGSHARWSRKCDGSEILFMCGFAAVFLARECIYGIRDLHCLAEIGIAQFEHELLLLIEVACDLTLDQCAIGNASCRRNVLAQRLRSTLYRESTHRNRTLAHSIDGA